MTLHIATAMAMDVPESCLGESSVHSGGVGQGAMATLTAF